MPLLSSLVRKSIHVTGALRIFRLANRNGVRVLMYHRFSEETRNLEWQCEHIRQNYHPISLDTYSDALNGGDCVPSNSLIVTVDDGYRDFLNAHPVFQRYEIPSTIYPVSDFIDGNLWLWWNQLDYAFAKSSSTSLKLNLGAKEMAVSFTTEMERLAACRDVAEAMTRVSDDERLRLLKLIPELLEVDIPSSPPDRWAPLKWDELRKLTKESVTVGAHTKTHAILSRLTAPDQQHEEIAGSKLRIEQELGLSVRHFCYPNGSFEDLDKHSIRAIQSSGFVTAATTERGLNFQDAQPLLLRRLGVEPDLPRDYFAELLAGARKQ